MSHLVIIDGHAIAHRAYHSIPPLSVNGQPVNALYGFYSMLLSAVDQLKPDYLTVCLDSPGPTFRNLEFVGYRAQRKPADRELISQLPLLPETLTTAKIPYFSQGGYEADDLIATIARRSLRRKFKKSKKPAVSRITVITGDKDLMQLVNQQISLFVPVRGLSESKLYDIPAVKEKLGVLPHQVVDLKGLMGDPSDNYPGISGIGPKSAISLLEKYQNLDNIYEHLEEIKPSFREKLVRDKDNAYLSQKLAQLISNIPLSFSLKSARWNKSKITALLSLFDEYRFKSLSSRLSKKLSSSTPAQPEPKKEGRTNRESDPNQSSLF